MSEGGDANEAQNIRLEEMINQTASIDEDASIYSSAVCGNTIIRDEIYDNATKDVITMVPVRETIRYKFSGKEISGNVDKSKENL